MTTRSVPSPFAQLVALAVAGALPALSACGASDYTPLNGPYVQIPSDGGSSGDARSDALPSLTLDAAAQGG